jgi:hypothetical protein
MPKQNSSQTFGNVMPPTSQPAQPKNPVNWNTNVAQMLEPKDLRKIRHVLAWSDPFGSFWAQSIEIRDNSHVVAFVEESSHRFLLIQLAKQDDQWYIEHIIPGLGDAAGPSLVERVIDFMKDRVLGKK